MISAVAGDDALAKLRANPEIDMLFTDIIMPGGMSGWELADLARQFRAGLPVVFSSGYALERWSKRGWRPRVDRSDETLSQGRTGAPDQGGAGGGGDGVVIYDALMRGRKARKISFPLG